MCTFGPVECSTKQIVDDIASETVKYLKCDAQFDVDGTDPHLLYFNGLHYVDIIIAYKHNENNLNDIDNNFGYQVV